MTQQKNAVASVSTVPGPQSVALFTAEQEFLSPGIQRIAQLARMTMSHGEGATLTDIDGNRYIDFYAGVTVASLGHAHPATRGGAGSPDSQSHRRQFYDGKPGAAA